MILNSITVLKNTDSKQNSTKINDDISITQNKHATCPKNSFT